MARTIEDAIWDKLIDNIQNDARTNDLRAEYDNVMGDRNYNNRDMTELHNHALKLVELGWDACRNAREEDKLIDDACQVAIDQHIGVWATSDKAIANAIDDDRVFRDLQSAAREFDAVEQEYDRAQNRGRGGRDDRGRGNDRGGRNNTGLGYSQARVPLGRDDRSRRDDSGTRMTGGFGGGSRSNSRDTRDRDDRPRENTRHQRDQVTSQRSSSPLTRNTQRQEEAPVERSNLQRHEPVDEVTQRGDGPDFSLDRPFDDFWDNNENWQLAHRSSFEWTWTPKQQFCRTYDPEVEVRFLVKDANGNVREEFLPMTDELSFAAHEIKALTRPNETRRIRSGNGRDEEISLPGNDIDAVDLDKLAGQVEEARKTLISEMNLNSVYVSDSPAVCSTVRDGLIKATSDRLNTDKDVAAVQCMLAEVLPSSGKGMSELEQLSNLIGSDGDLATLQKRLITLRGKVDESVLDVIDRHYTAEVNHSLKHAFGFGGLDIDSFIEDFADLLAVITKRRNAGFTSQFLSRTRNLVVSLVIVNGLEERREVINAQDILPEAEEDKEAYTKFRDNAVVLLKPSPAVSINIDLDAFGLVTDEPRVATASGPGADKELRDTLVGLYAIGRRASASGRVRLITADNIELELVAIAGAKDVVGIRKL